MTDSADLPMHYPDAAPATPTGARPKPHRHEWEVRVLTTGGTIIPSPSRTMGHVAVLPDTRWECVRCGKVRDEAAARRGRNNRKRGGAIQRQRIVGLGGQNLAGNNPNLDGLGLAFRYESKSGGAFSERVWRWLSGIPIQGDQTRVLLVTEAPGPGRKARAYVVVEYDAWRDLHGEETR